MTKGNPAKPKQKTSTQRAQTSAKQTPAKAHKKVGEKKAKTPTAPKKAEAAKPAPTKDKKKSAPKKAEAAKPTKGHMQVVKVTRRATYAAQGVVRGQLVIDEKLHMHPFSINDSGEIQIGMIGSVLQWTALSRFSIRITRDDDKGTCQRDVAVLKDTFPGSEFEIVVIWEPNVDDTLQARLVLSDEVEETETLEEEEEEKAAVDPKAKLRRILGVLELEPPSGLKKVLRATHIASPQVQRGPGTYTKQTKKKEEGVPAAEPLAQKTFKPYKQLPRFTGTGSGSGSGSGAKRQKLATGGPMDEDQRLGDQRITVVEDDGVDGVPYQTPLAAGLIPNVNADEYVLNGYRDDAFMHLPNEAHFRIHQSLRIQDVNERWAGVFGAVGSNVSIHDAETIVSRQGATNPWYNDTVICAFLNLLRGHERRKANRDVNYKAIHIHNEFTMSSLYQASNVRPGEFDGLPDVARTHATASNNKNVMSTAHLSLMIVNLYGDHWYLLLIFPGLKRIDCLNWLPTAAMSIRVLCRLLHVYLYTHSIYDPSFDFNAGEWTLRVIKPSRCPQQQNGYDCGAFTCKAAEWIIAGKALDFTQDSFPLTRYQHLYAIKSLDICRLSRPGVAVTAQAVAYTFGQQVVDLINGVDGANVELNPNAMEDDERDRRDRVAVQALVEDDVGEGWPEYLPSQYN